MFKPHKATCNMTSSMPFDRLIRSLPNSAVQRFSDDSSSSCDQYFSCFESCFGLAGHLPTGSPRVSFKQVAQEVYEFLWRSFCKPLKRIDATLFAFVTTRPCILGREETLKLGDPRPGNLRCMTLVKILKAATQNSP